MMCDARKYWPLLVALLLWGAGAAAYWLLVGWQLPPRDPVPSISPEFPADLPVAVLLAIVAAVVYLVTGLTLLPARHAVRWSMAQRLAVAFLVGTAFSGALFAWFAFVHIHLVLLPLPLVAAVLIAWRRLTPLKVSPWRLPGWEAWLALVLLLLVFLAAGSPPLESDGLRYHLAAPQEWLRAGRFVPIPYNANSNLPAMLGLVSAVPAPTPYLGRVFQILHALHTAALVVMAAAVAEQVVRSLLAARRMRSDATLLRTVRASQMLLIVSVPVIAIVGAWPFSDIASAAYLFAGIWASTPGAFRTARCRILFASLLLGACVATKISNLPLAGLVGLWILVRDVIPALRQRGRSCTIRLALLIIPGLVVLGPWLIKNAIYHGNPVYPVAYGVFGGAEWSDANDAFYQSKMKEKGSGHDIAALISSPVNVFRQYVQFEGHNPGPALLALMPACVAGGILVLLQRRRRMSPALFLALFFLAGWIFWFRTYQSVRFLVPQIVAVLVGGGAFILFAAHCGGALARLAARIVLALIAVAGGLWAPYYRTAIMPDYAAALGLYNNEILITRRFNAYPAVLWLNSETAADEPVFYIGEFRTYYAFNYRPIASDWFDTPRVLVEIRETRDNEQLLDRWRNAGMRYVLFNQGELRLYEQLYFRPRFTDAEWARFEDLRKTLLDNIVFDGDQGAFVVGLE